MSTGGEQTLVDGALQFGIEAQAALSLGEVHPGQALVVLRPEESDRVGLGGRELGEEFVD
ncbi:MAG: hypothetical protein RL413_1565, partial [Actinomycetota bacterium]